jgi:hypothetical protein
MADVINEAHAIDDDHVLLITTTGVRLFHIIGGPDEATAKALQDFLDAGGEITPAKQRSHRQRPTRRSR